MSTLAESLRQASQLAADQAIKFLGQKDHTGAAIGSQLLQSAAAGAMAADAAEAADRRAADRPKG